MISPFARLVDYAVAFHFKKDPSGRLVFLPLISKGQGYFVDSKSDEEKLRAFVKMYCSANLLLTLLCYLVILAPTSLGYNLYAGAIPMRTKLMTAVGTGLFWVLCYGASAWTLWNLYKKNNQKLHLPTGRGRPRNRRSSKRSLEWAPTSGPVDCFCRHHHHRSRPARRCAACSQITASKSPGSPPFLL